MNGAEWQDSSGHPQQPTGLALLHERLAHDSAWQWLESLVALLREFQYEANCGKGVIELSATSRPAMECSGHTHLERISQSLVERFRALNCVHAALAEELAHIRSRLTRVNGKIPDFGQVHGPRLAPWQVRRARAFIAANVAVGISTSDIGAVCGLSRSYFTNAFRRTTGETPHLCLLRHRIEKAKQLLLGDLAIADVAVACGFADQSHLTRTFSKHSGISPGLWRRERRESTQLPLKTRAGRQSSRTPKEAGLTNPKATIAYMRTSFPSSFPHGDKP